MHCFISLESIFIKKNQCGLQVLTEQLATEYITF